MKKTFNKVALDDLSSKDIEHITDHLMIESTELYPADLAFVFGSVAFCDELVEKTYELYDKGYFPKIIACGGVINKQGTLESHYIRDRLNQKGIPKSDILVEDKSTNTQQNIENAKIIIDKDIGLKNIKSLIGIGQLYAARRYMMTMKRRWPEVFNMHASVNGFGKPRSKWFKDKDFSRFVLSEWNKLQEYPKKDFIREIDLDEINNKVRKWKATNPKLNP
jgi:hypothetical protein